jgi:hypothetical protein
MRKLTVGLIAVALLATAAPARAQWADPLGLVASGLIIPYVGNGTISPGSQSWLEVYAPVGDESGFHMFFFDTTCARKGDSVGLPLTANDVAILRVDNLGGANPVEGLIAAADVDNTGFNLVPMSSAVHARMLWVNGGTGSIRILEPISIWHPETSGPSFSYILPILTPPYTWNPLRSGATFFAPLESAGINTTIYFICPTTAVTNDIGTFFDDGSTTTFKSGAFPITVGAPYPFGGFPPLLDSSFHSVQTSSPTNLRVRVFDTDERFLRDVTTTCDCLTAKPVTSISQVYASVAEAAGGTYSEVEGNSTKAVPPVCDFLTLIGNTIQDSTTPAPSCAQAVATVQAPCDDIATGTCTTYNLFKVVTPAIPAKGPAVFTGYRAIVFGGVDIFGRLQNGHQLSIQGNGLGPVTPGVQGLQSYFSQPDLFFAPR